MKLCRIRCHCHTGRWRSSPCAALLLLALTAGCASPRPPRPPSLDLPEIPKDLNAQRLADQVVLHWTTPEKTTDRLDIKGPVTAEICRIDHPDAHPLPPCSPVIRVVIHSGASQATDPLPQPLTSGPATLLGYRIQLFNLHSRSAGLSPQIAFAAAGAAPLPIVQLQATAVPTGVKVEWRSQNTSAPVELDRLLVRAANPRPPKSTPKAPVSGKSGTHSAASKSPQGAAPSPDQIKLRTPQQATDPGGTVDQTALTGDSYRYTAQRVLTVSLDGHSLTLRSLPSTPVTLTVRDTFPPATPTGLEAVPGEATSANSSARQSIDLSWTPDTDADLAGYIVYRQNAGSTGALAGPLVRLNPVLLPGPAYRDQTAVRGQRYAYRVTAVDTSGNESAPSADVQETLREP